MYLDGAAPARKSELGKMPVKRWRVGIAAVADRLQDVICIGGFRTAHEDVDVAHAARFVP